MSDKQSHRSADEFLKYLKGELSEKERHSLERELERDPFAREAMEGMEQISAPEAEQDLLDLHDRLRTRSTQRHPTMQRSTRKRSTRKRKIFLYSMAAAVASFLIVGTLFLQLYDFSPSSPDSQEYLEEAPAGEVPPKGEPQNALPSPAEREDEDEEPDQAETAKKLDTEKSLVVQAEAEGKAEPPIPPVRKRSPEGQTRAAINTEEPPVETEAFEMVVVEAEPVSDKEASFDVQTKSGKDEGQLTGTIRSARDRTPIPGASLSIEGENAVSITDMEGRFSIPVTGDSQSMVTASFAGMESQEFVLPAEEGIELSLQPEMQKKEQVPEKPPARVARPDALQKTTFTPRPPEPSEGYIQFYRYIEEKGNYPHEENGPGEALVILRFTVTSEGEVQEIFPVSSPGVPFTDEAIRLLKEGPAWIPAFNSEGPVEKEVRLRIELKK